jgi:hypothetical protein
MARLTKFHHQHGGTSRCALGASTEVVVREPDIQDVALIRLAPMTEATSTSHGGLELFADDLVDPAVIARNLESMRRAEQWMKVHCRTLRSLIS